MVLPRFSPLAATAVLAAALGACQPPAPPRPPPLANAIIVLVDTLRADHLAAYGYARPTTPEFDRLATEGTLFERAYSQAACTFPSVNSLLSSRPAPLFWGQPEGHMGIPEAMPTLAEALAARGLTTLAVSASPVVRKSPTRFNPAGGFDRGFDVFDEQCLWRDAGCVADRALDLLAKAREPYFAYLHFMDPHGPYQPPPEHRRRFASEYTGTLEFIARGNTKPVARGLPADAKVVLASTDLEHLEALYDEEIAWWDQHLGAMVRELKRRGSLDRTALVVVADHGEAFLEHGQLSHCHTVFDEETRVPMLIRLPGAAPRRVAVPVENLDLAPTLLAALGLPPEPAFAGRSLLPVLRGEVTDSRPSISAQGPLRAAVDGRFKLVLNLANGRESLYDLSADPGESRDVAGEQPDDFRRLRRLLGDRLAATEGPPERAVAAGREAEERLRSLGYLQ